MARPSFTRSASSASSCIVVDAEAALASSAASTTPPTSITDVGSVTSRTSTKVPSAGDTMTSTTSTNGRARRARPSILSYNENTLSDAARRRSLPLLRTQASSATLLPGAGESQRELVRNSIAVLDMDWKMDGMPGDAMLKDGGRLQRRRSMGMLLESATEKVGKTKSALGKRGRDALEAGKGKLKDLGRRKSLRPRTDLGFVHVPEPEEEPAKKKTRLSAAADKDDEEEKLYEEIKRKPSVKKPTKRWLGQGLYVGQDPDFDPRFTDSRNRAKMASKSGEASKPRKILPMPMFAGKRLIENGRPFRIPFDVFNPLPLGQPKPDEWRKTQKNVFIGDAAELWKTAKKREHSLCICTPETGCDEDCFNRIMFYECDESNCNVGAAHCTNRSFADLRERCKAGGKYNIGVEVIKTKDRGYGVRSNRMFAPNQIIVEYAGEIITQEECEHRVRKTYKDNECFYLMVFDQNMVIDATRGSIARFVNHACEPNCRMVKWTVAGKPRMALFAGDNGIMTGEELTYDYNFDPFSAKNIQECRCGSTTCRGVLGPRPVKEVKEARDALKPLVPPTGTKRKLQAAVSDATSALASKKRRLSVKASATLTKVRAVVASEAGQRWLVKKASERSLTAAAGAKANEGGDKTAAKLKRRVTIALPAKIEREGRARPLSRRGSVKSVATDVGKNVVTTIKGRAGGRVLGSKKSIRVIEA